MRIVRGSPRSSNLTDSFKVARPRQLDDSSYSTVYVSGVILYSHVEYTVNRNAKTICSSRSSLFSRCFQRIDIYFESAYTFGQYLLLEKQ